LVRLVTLLFYKSVQSTPPRFSRLLGYFLALLFCQTGCSGRAPFTTKLDGGGVALIFCGVLHLSRGYIAYELGEGYRVAGALESLGGHI
jgi:hypothetical protein